jgi:hypothetical protein
VPVVPPVPIVPPVPALELVVVVAPNVEVDVAAAPEPLLDVDPCAPPLPAAEEVDDARLLEQATAKSRISQPAGRPAMNTRTF